MRYAVISDIHSNLEALTAVLDKIDGERVDRVVCLGDLVGYYADPNECLKIVRARAIRSIAGNHDRAATGAREPAQFGEAGRRAIFWTRGELSDESRLYLEQLPISDFVDDRFLMVHAALHPEPNEDLYLVSRAQVMRSFEKLAAHRSGAKICFFGHTHQSVVHACRNGMISKLDGNPVKLEKDDFYLVNPGSVGQSRDEDERAAFLIFDSDRSTAQFYRVTYDRDSCLRKAGEAGLLYEEGLVRKSVNWMSDWVEAGADAIKRRLPGI